MSQELQHLKVLVIRFSSIGDIVLTTPVLRCLKQTPGIKVEIHFVTKEEYAVLLLHNPHIDKLHLLDGRLTELIGKLRAERFDLVVDLHNNLRSAYIKLVLRRPNHSFRKLNLEKWLLTNFKKGILPKMHLVERYFEAVSSVGVVNDGKGLDFFFPEGQEVMPSGIPKSFHEGFVAFVIGGKHATKRLPNEKIIGICKQIPCRVLLIGGREDAANGEAIAAACGSEVFNGCGLFSLPQSAFLVKRARLVISHDTGLMHIAAAFNKQLISVWGNTVPEFGMVPYMPEHPERSVIIEVKDLQCRPCTKIGYARCPKGHFDCMMKINELLIVQKAVKYLESAKDQ